MIDAVKLAQKLIQFKSVTGCDDGIIDYIISVIEPYGFICRKYEYNGFTNLYAKYGKGKDNLCFVGHVDVVPPGVGWKYNPHNGIIDDDILYGRGAVDMKSAIACFITAANSYIVDNSNCTISIMLTADEESSSKFGMIPLLEDLKEQSEIIDICIVGEPTCEKSIGDTIKIGRRGSVNYKLVVNGIQGHVAYPEKADNPIYYMVKILNELKDFKLDDGNENFAASNLEITSIDVDNETTNVIPAQATARFNIRFNDIHSSKSLTKFIEQICSKYSNSYSLNIISASESFKTDDQRLINIVSNSIKDVIGRTPSLSTGGGTSDARFITNYYSVIEFGLINKTAHKVDEHASLNDIILLKDIYLKILENYNL